MRYYLTVGLLAVASVGASAQTYNFSFDGRDKTGIQLTANDVYDAQKGYGFDFVDIVKDSPLISERFDNEVRGTKGTVPFFLSVNVPDGNYKVTVTLGAKKQRGNTVVRAESRRLMLEDIETKKGEFKTYSFVVNKRNTEIWGTERGSSERKVVDRVRIKEREKTKLNWDNKLTLEVSGEQPACSSIRIEPAPASVPTVFLCGNSTVVDQDYEPWASWGQMIPRWFDDGVAIANYGESGETASTFIGAGRLKKILSLMKEGDYIFVEFGHNDQKQKFAGAGAWYNFSMCLKQFIDGLDRGPYTDIAVGVKEAIKVLQNGADGLGFYQVEPSGGRYQLGCPIVRKARINVGGGRTFVVETVGNPSKGRVRKWILNGKMLNRTYITHDEVMSGGELKALF